MACLSMGMIVCSGIGIGIGIGIGSGGPSAASLPTASLRMAAKPTATPASLHSSFRPYSALSSLSSASLFGSSVGFIGSTKRRGLVVMAKKYALCQTKRNRSRKSLARTHGFRKRMSTTSGRALIKRRRAKGRLDLAPKSSPRTGKRA